MSEEAIRIPCAGAVFWAEALPDGSNGVRAISGPPPALKVTLTGPLPGGVTTRSGSRGIALLTRPLSYDHIPSEAELAAAPSLPAMTVTGTAEPLDGRFHPRRFSVVPSPAGPSFVALRPSLHAIRVGEAGALVLNLRWQDGAAASWAIVRLTCLRNGVTLGFAAQADLRGDAIVPLTGLPPLPASQTSDQMTLTVAADRSQAGQTIADPDAVRAVAVSIGGAFAAQQSLTVPRGRISTAATLSIPGLTLQPV